LRAAHIAGRLRHCFSAVNTPLRRTPYFGINAGLLVIARYQYDYGHAEATAIISRHGYYVAVYAIRHTPKEATVSPRQQPHLLRLVCFTLNIIRRRQPMPSAISSRLVFAGYATINFRPFDIYVTITITLRILCHTPTTCHSHEYNTE